MDRAERKALTSDEKAAIAPNAKMVLYRLNRRIERVVIEPLLFKGVSSSPGPGVY